MNTLRARATLVGILVGWLGVGVSGFQPLSNQVLQLLTRPNTFTATNTFLDLRLARGVPTVTLDRFYEDNAGNLYFNSVLVAGAVSGSAPHALLSTTHSDTLAGAVVRGDVIIGNATPAWSRLPVGAAGSFLSSNGTDVSWGTSGAALTALPAANLTGTAAAISGVNITALNASNLASGTVPTARLTGVITNAEVSATAAIAYSKLSLTTSVVNGDIATAAAIAYSKLSLGLSVLNSDLANGQITFVKWASNACTVNQVPQYNGAAWQCATLGAGTGTVTSVALTTPNIFTVAGSPLTSSGTLAVSLATQAANLVWAGPASGAAANPAFRALVNLDLPTTGVAAASYPKVTVNAQGVVTAAASQITLTTDVTGVLPRANGGTGVSTSLANTVLVGSGTAWVAQTVPDCPSGALGYTQATSLFSCTSTGGPAHNLLSVTHTDTVAAAPVRGDLLAANTTPAWTKVAIGTAGTLLQSNALDPSWTNTIARGTVTVSTPWTWTQTWNAGAVTFTGWLVNITDNTSQLLSKLLDLQVAGVSKFSVDKTGNVIAAGTLNTTGAVTGVGGLTTAGNGVPLLLATTGLLATQAANIAVTNLTASAAAGFYRVCAFEAVTQAATSSSTMPAVTIKFNNGVAQTNTLIATNTGNTTTTYGQACVVLQSSAAQAITYDAGTTSGPYVSVGATPLQFQLRVTLEALY